MRAKFTWVTNTLAKRIPFFAPGVKAEIDLRMEQLARDLQTHMKQNAPWSDRTGQAREGLNAEVVKKLLSSEIVLYNDAEHGFWLEVAMNGEYAIIIPTLEMMDGFYGPAIKGIIGNSSVGFRTI